jgi:peptidoglycan/LPS O-acetylase OafA/YrhL
MTSWRRWQDYATMVFGVLLFISPLVFGETSHDIPTRIAYVLGVLLFASGVVAAMTREARRSLIVNAPGIAAVITIIAAIVLGVAGLDGDPFPNMRGAPGIAWTAGVLAILTVLVGATLRLGRQAELKTDSRQE